MFTKNRWVCYKKFPTLQEAVSFADAQRKTSLDNEIFVWDLTKNKIVAEFH
jgi:hypothetical protein